VTDQELHELRRERWRLDGRAVRTLEDAREFIESVGFCLMYPLPRQGTRVPVLAPTFIGAWIGGDDRLPTWQSAFADPRAAEATALMVRLLRERAAYEANLFGETSFLIAASVFPYFYALTGDRNPRQMPKPGTRPGYSPLARDVLEAVRREGPISKPRLRQRLGGAPSPAALDRALGELWSKLRITRVDYQPDEGAFWDVLFRWSPAAVREGIQLSVGESLSALLSKYLDSLVAADQGEIEDLFSHFVPRSKVKEAIGTLLGAREFSFLHVGKRTLLQLAPARQKLYSQRSQRDL
jgi:hypothetical protein